MKRELDVTAHRTATEFDKKGSLISTVELRVPADELEYMGEVLQAQEREKNVRCALIIRSKQDGEPRRLALTLKNSKMKDFVPVAIFTKYGVASDNLTQLFDTGWYGGYELLLVVEVIEPKQDAEPLNFDAAPATPTWVLSELQHDDLAVERYLGEGCPHCTDHLQDVDSEYTRVADLVAGADYDDVCNLLVGITIDPSDWEDPASSEAEDLISMRQTLMLHWKHVAALELRELAV